MVSPWAFVYVYSLMFMPFAVNENLLWVPGKRFTESDNDLLDLW